MVRVQAPFKINYNFMKTSNLTSKFVKYILFAAFCFFTLGSYAQIKTDFSPRYSGTVNGDITMIGNNVVSLHKTNNYNGDENNNDLTLVFVDIDNDSSTFNSSNASLVNPSPSSPIECLEIVGAYLYWAAADKEYGIADDGSSAGNGGSEPNWNFNQVKLMLPGSNTYRTVTADETIYTGRPEHFDIDPYVCVKNITSDVQALANPFGRFQLANVKATEGNLQNHDQFGRTGTSGGWQIVFVYESPELKRREVTFFDGYAQVTQTINNFNVEFDGFQTVPFGTVKAKLLVSALEGDRSYVDDRLEIRDKNGNFTALRTNERDANNFFNSKITLDDQPFVNRIPASGNTTGYDAALFSLENNDNNLIDNNQTSTTIRMTSNLERYGLFLLGLSVEVFEPSLGALEFTTAIESSTFDAGDTIPMQIGVKNVGNDDLENLQISTVLPEQVDFLNADSLPSGVSFNYNSSTRELTFFVEDGNTDINDLLYTLDFNLLAVSSCISCATEVELQATASFTGETNTTSTTSVSSGTIDSCGRGDFNPSILNIIPDITINDVSASEGNNMAFTISSSHLLSNSSQFNISYTNNSTTNSDYSGPATVTIPANSSSTTFNISAVDDDIIEPTENFSVFLSNNSTSIDIIDSEGIGTIIDNDIPDDDDGISVTGFSINEDAGTVNFTITYSGLTLQDPFTVNYDIFDGSASNPEDYFLDAASNVLNFPANTAGGNTQVVTINIVDDTIFEGNENLNIVLSDVSTSQVKIINDSAIGTIIDNDVPDDDDGISVADFNVNENTGTADFIITYTGPTISETFSVDFNVTDGTATNPEDYSIATTGTSVNFPANTNSGDTQVVTINIVNDELLEGSENLEIILSNVSITLVKILDDEAIGTIIDSNLPNDDDGISVADFSVNEDVGAAEFVITYSGPTIQEAFTVDFTVTDGSATNPEDYFVANSGNSLSFPPNTEDGDTQVVTINIINDNLLEGNENFNITLSNISNDIIEIVDNNGVGTIVDNSILSADDGISVADFAINEDAGAADFVITYMGPTVAEAFTIDFNVADGSATNPEDYSLVTPETTVNFPENTTTGDTQMVTVSIVNDNLLEGSENLSIILSDISTTLVVIVDDEAIGTIIDNEVPGDDDGISVADFSVNEDAGTAEFVLSYAGPTIQETFTVDFTVSDGLATNPEDYAVVNSVNSISFPANTSGGDRQVVTINIVNDDLLEGNENLNISISNLSTSLVEIRDDEAIGTIVDNEELGDNEGVSVADFSVDEDAGTADFVVTYAGPTVSTAFSVDFVVTDGSATNPEDYFLNIAGNSLSFPANTEEGDMQVVTIDIVNDIIIENTEDLTIEISNISNPLLTIIDDSANGIIIDNDGGIGAGISFANTNIIATEGTDEFAVFIVTMTGMLSENVAVNYTTVDGTATSSEDITTTSGTLTFSPTENSFEIRVPITNDNIIEPQEAFTVVLSNIVSNLNVGFVDGNTANVANGTLIDDDAASEGVGIAFENAEVIVTEGSDEFAIFTVTLVGTISEDVSVDYVTADGSAINSEDYLISEGTITFTPDTSSIDIQVPITNDLIIEPQEAFTIVLSNVQSNLEVGFVDRNATDTANGLINDDDLREILVESYDEEITMNCGEEIPEVPELVFFDGCGDYTFEFSQSEEFTSGTDDYMIVRTWNVTDACTNMATFEQVIFVLQVDKELIEIDICIEDEPIDLLSYLPEGFDTNGIFTIEDGNVSLDGSIFNPMSHVLQQYRISYEAADTLCNFYAEFTIDVNKNCVPCDINDLIVSSTITVNGDGVNDYFQLQGLEQCEFSYKVMIFNRWGTTVFEAENYENDWSGFSPSGSFGSTKILPSGTYYYIISVADRPEIKPINGFIYIGSE